MSYDYSENILVQESAGNLLRDELGWDVRFAYNTEVLGKNGTFGRESYKEILLLRYFHESLKTLNPWMNESQISEAQKALENRLSTSSPLQVNEEKYFLIRDGIPVTVKKPNGQTETKKAAVIDFQNPDNNYFLAVKELKMSSPPLQIPSAPHIPRAAPAVSLAYRFHPPVRQLSNRPMPVSCRS